MEAIILVDSLPIKGIIKIYQIPSFGMLLGLPGKKVQCVHYYYSKLEG